MKFSSNIFCLFTKCSSFSPETQNVGDLILDDQHWTKTQLDILGRPENMRVTRGISTEDLVRRWPGNSTSKYLEIPYRFENESYPKLIKYFIKNTMDELSNEHLDGCIRWIDDTETQKYNYWINLLNNGEGTGCWSNVGHLGDVENQNLNLAPECWSTEVVIHEFLHSMGFQHEHERPDRDEYITIHWDRIIENKKQYFQKMRTENWVNIESGYDINSIMHFPHSAFRTDEARSKFLPVMTLLETGEPVQFPRVKTMSIIDDEQLRAMYPKFCPSVSKPLEPTYGVTEPAREIIEPDESPQVFGSGENGTIGNSVGIFVLLSVYLTCLLP